MTLIPQPSHSLAAIREAENIASHLNEWCSTFGALAVDRLADPALCPSLYRRVVDLSHRLWTAEDVHYIDHALDGAKPFDRDDPAMMAIPMLHFAGEQDTVHVLRDPSTVTDFGGLHRLRWPVGHCDLAEAVDCRGEDALGVYATISRPPWILAFEVCDPCLQALAATAEAGDILAEADARVAFDGAAKAAVERWTGGAR
ncbi:hypothetical protein [Mycolicibacterium lacusdiani]|uniref:hypothetical protein n=1 Tax=Mycolicibacterium lacusdiani TaxID=2895283 RepID=UPI001F25F6CE|nr:hypothetical protein [Mycolicibacterium lacusdiani]